MPLAIGWYVWGGGIFALLWLICLLSAGVLTWKHGHIAMFFIGFIFPLLWIIGAAYERKPERPRY